MYFEEDDDDGFLVEHPDVYRFVSREIFALSPHLDSRSFGFLKSVPTHTEDGIPIRKLYVSNLPPKTTRTELFGVFAQYGFIKSCWLRIGEKGPNKSPMATYAFVTYSNPADAHKALEAPLHEKMLRGRQLRISPADSWHQPAQDADGRVRWKPRRTSDCEQGTSAVESTAEQGEGAPEPSCSEPEVPVESEESPEVEEYSILDILNRDCLMHILGYVPITDLIRSERVNKRWQSMVQEYIQSIRVFKTSWWRRGPLTTAVLRRLLARAGGALQRLHIDHHWSALNDRTAHTVGKFCPYLDELKVVGMHTKNWNPLIYGCKQLRILSFISCNKLTDASLVQIVKRDSCVESLTVANNTHVTGLFLTGSDPLKLNSLSFYNCYSLQGTVLCAAIDTLPQLTTLKLDACPTSMWKIIPLILNKLPGLRELSLSEYMSIDFLTTQNNDFCESLANLTELRVLNLFKNIYVTNAVLKQVAQSCTKLESLNISSCNSRKNYSGVSDEGVLAVCSSCRALARLDVSYLAALSDEGLRALVRLPQLAALVARGNIALSASPLAAALAHCHHLQELDVCGCDGVSEEVALAAERALAAHPRPLLLRLAGTAVNTEELPTHKLLTINVDEDLSNPNLRPDFIDHAFDVSSEDSFDDLYEHENFDEFFRRENIYFPHSGKTKLSTTATSCVTDGATSRCSTGKISRWMSHITDRICSSWSMPVSSRCFSSPLDDELFIDEDDLDDDFEGVYAYGLNGQDIILL